MKKLKSCRLKSKTFLEHNKEQEAKYVLLSLTNECKPKKGFIPGAKFVQGVSSAFITTNS